MSLLDNLTQSLGVARWQRTLLLVTVVGIAMSVTGFLVGQRWERGTQALG
jgi:hypothetical protein